jgi:hypothetical protein
MYTLQHMQFTDKKENEIFLIYKEIQNGTIANSFMTNGLLILMGNNCAFSHILGSPSSCMTLQLLHSEFPHIYEKKCIFFFISESANSCADSPRADSFKECEMSGLFETRLSP